MSKGLSIYEYIYENIYEYLKSKNEPWISKSKGSQLWGKKIMKYYVCEVAFDMAFKSG